MTRYKSLALLLCATAVTACGDKAIQNIAEPASATNAAYVKFFNFSVGAPGVNFYSNATKVTAVSTTACVAPNDTTTVCTTTGSEATTGTTYSNPANAGLYALVAAGSDTLRGKIISTTATNGVNVSNTSTTLATGQYYSYYLSGIYNSTTNTSDAFMVVDTMPAVDFNNAYVRFVNAISNSQPMTLYAKNDSSLVEVPVGAIAAYQGEGGFVKIPPAVYDLNTRTAGSSTNLITRTQVSFVAGHVYTITARGDMTASSGTNKPALDNTANR